MTKHKKSPIYKFLNDHQVTFLLFSILLLLFVLPFIDLNSYLYYPLLKFNFLLIVISCYFIIKKIKISKYIAIITFIMISIEFFVSNKTLEFLAQLGVSILIFNAFVIVLKKAISPKGSSENLIIVSITGYLILGLIGGFLVALLQFLIPNSFSHTTGIELEFPQMIYYSYVTITTLGYGDIIPLTEKSQALALFLTISGQLFLTVIMAINIAKIMKEKLSK